MNCPFPSLVLRCKPCTSLRNFSPFSIDLEGLSSASFLLPILLIMGTHRLRTLLLSLGILEASGGNQQSELKSSAMSTEKENRLGTLATLTTILTPRVTPKLDEKAKPLGQRMHFRGMLLVCSTEACGFSPSTTKQTRLHCHKSPR